MWPGEDRHSTDGVEAVFLGDDSDSEGDELPIGAVLYGGCYVGGEWGLNAREVLRQ